MITRTIESTRVNALCMDVNTAEPMNKEFNLSGTFKKKVKDEDGNKTETIDEKKMLKALQKEFDTDSFKVVHIVDHEIIETLYGMPEQDFLSQAKVLDPETRQPIAE